MTVSTVTIKTSLSIDEGDDWLDGGDGDDQLWQLVAMTLSAVVPELTNCMATKVMISWTVATMWTR